MSMISKQLFNCFLLESVIWRNQWDFTGTPLKFKVLSTDCFNILTTNCMLCQQFGGPGDGPGVGKGGGSRRAGLRLLFSNIHFHGSSIVIIYCTISDTL